MHKRHFPEVHFHCSDSRVFVQICGYMQPHFIPTEGSQSIINWFSFFWTYKFDESYWFVSVTFDRQLPKKKTILENVNLAPCSLSDVAWNELVLSKFVVVNLWKIRFWKLYCLHQMLQFRARKKRMLVRQLVLRGKCGLEEKMMETSAGVSWILFLRPLSMNHKFFLGLFCNLSSYTWYGFDELFGVTLQSSKLYLIWLWWDGEFWNHSWSLEHSKNKISLWNCFSFLTVLKILDDTRVLFNYFCNTVHLP